ncbi:uncharacterized protein PRCAT00006310001 [Priceomyces carsonii]|uniref:uncharacterized protein n=1 Tax=Priceomyces carsonii TaxID=28549 RepID=UPI002ED79C6A|nr:unnamed protein product [Priceomyces carsonii]
MSKNKDPLSLINMQRDYVLSQLKSVQIPGNLYVLVTDEKVESMLNQVVSKDQLLRIVTSTERIDGKKRQQQFMEAIYFVDLTLYNMKCILGDIQTGKYKKGYGLFLPILWEGSKINLFFRSANFMQNPKVNSYFNGGENIRYVPASFCPVETRVFLADNKTPTSMPIFFNENFAELVLPQIKLVARSLVNLMVITGEYPIIRFYSLPDSNHQASRLSELIADEFQTQIDNYARLNEDYPPPSLRDRPRSILLICDRTLDLYAPLLHEFSYQAMAMDIVHSLERTGKYKYKSENEKGEIAVVETTLDNEDDEDWVNLRHLHIIESSEVIINKINDLIQSNPLMIDRSKATTSSDLIYIVAHLKGFDQERRQITLHKNLIDECLDINASRKLAEFAADFEQTCAANGVSFEGVRNKNLHDDLIVLLARDDLHINDKMRLVLIYGLYRGGLIEADFIKLVKFIGVNDRQIISLISRCFTNLHKLGFPIVKENLQAKKVIRHMYHTINNEGTYNTSRFIPGLKNVLLNVAKYQQDEDAFPYFRDKPLEDDIPASGGTLSSSSTNNPSSLRNARVKASWAQPSNKVSQSSFRPKQRIFCYVAGGMTYSEMRSVYELSDQLNKDFYIGSETILRPRDFLIGLQSIDTAKSSNDLDLNLIRELNQPTEPPLYLFEPDRPKAPPLSAVPNTLDAHRLTAAAAATSSSSSLPLHYQKRLQNNYTSDSQVSPEKHKKKNKLKNLFK